MGYREELEKVRTELLEREDQYITFKDLVERFDEVEEEYLGKAWNLLQIYNNFNILQGEEKIDSPNARKEETATEQEMVVSRVHTVELPWKELKGCREACQEALSALNRIRGIDENVRLLQVASDTTAGRSELTVAMEEAAKMKEQKLADFPDINLIADDLREMNKILKKSDKSDFQKAMEEAAKRGERI